jgi:hypothetical protein
MISPAHAALESLQYAGQVYELAWRLRNAPLSSAARIEAIAQEAAIGPRQLLREVLPTLQQLGWVECHYNDRNELDSVDAVVPPANDLIASVGTLLNIVMATPVQRAALALLRATSLQPLEEATALEVASEFGDEAAAQALHHLISIQLVRQTRSEDGRTVVFNPNVWTGGDEELTRATLRAEDAQAQTHVGALLEEVAGSPGIPETHVTSTEQRWIDFAVGVGLIQRSVVQTSGGDEKGFLFSPHLCRTPFGSASGDPSGHVRQLVGSMIYAATFAGWKLRSPEAFLYTLIRDGIARDRQPDRPRAHGALAGRGGVPSHPVRACPGGGGPGCHRRGHARRAAQARRRHRVPEATGPARTLPFTCHRLLWSSWVRPLFRPSALKAW